MSSKVPRIVSAVLAVFAVLSGAAFAQSFQIEQSQINIVVAPEFRHAEQRVPISGTAAGFDFSTMSVTSDASWVVPSIDAANKEVVLTYQTAGLIASGYTATITVTAGATSDFFAVKASVAPLNITKLVDDPLRSRMYGIQQDGLNAGAVIVIDPLTNAKLNCLTVGRKPTDFAVSKDGNELLVLNAVEKTLTAIDLATLRVKETITLPRYTNWGEADTTGDVAYGSGNVIYYTDGAWAPILYVFNRVTGQVLQQVNDDTYGFGDFALTPDGSKLIGWAQYGWTAGIVGSYITKYTVNANGTLTFAERTSSTYPTVLNRDPLDTPVLIDAAGERAFVKQLAVSPANVGDTFRSFPGPVFSISPGGEVAATASAIFQVSTNVNLYALPVTTTVQAITSDYARLVYFDKTARTLGSIKLLDVIGPQVLGRDLSPADGSITLAPSKLEWTPLPGVDKYQVYLGLSESDVLSATTGNSSYLGEVSAPSIPVTGTLMPGTRYFWRIDAVSSGGVAKGDVYEFTVSTISTDLAKIEAATVQGHANYQVDVKLNSVSAGAVWTASADKNWVGFASTSGTTPGTLSVQLNASQLAPGVYTATISVATGGQAAFTIPVTLEVDPLALTVMESDRQSGIVYGISEKIATTGGTSRAYLLELDSVAQTIKRVVRVGSSATDLAVHNQEGRVYVANWKGGVLLALDKTTLKQVQGYGFTMPDGYTTSDVYRIAAGVQGRLLVESEDQWITLGIFDTVAGKMVKTSSSREGGGEFDPTGRYYYHGDNNISNASIHKYDLMGDVFTETANTRVESVSYYGSRTVVVSEDGERVFWNGAYLNKNLVVQWLIADEIFSTSPNGKLAFSASKVYDVDGRRALLSMPASTKVSAFNSTSSKLVVQVGSEVKFFDLGSTTFPTPMLSVGLITGSSIQVNWTDESLETAFTLQYRVKGAADWLDISPAIQANIITYTKTALSPQTEYEFRVKADSPAYSSAWSNTVTATTLSAVVPVATTGAATGIQPTSATLNGTANPKGFATNVYFQYGTTTAYGSVTSTGSAGSGTTDVAVTRTISGLQPSTIYHFRLVVISTEGTIYGSDATFTTGATVVIKPSVSPLSPTGITSESATLRASINPNGSATTAYFEYGTTPSFGQTTQSQSTGSTLSSTFSQAISSLAPNTLYYYRVVATNAGGVTAGTILTFSTAGLKPTVSVFSATLIASESATLQATINPNGIATTAYFEYGTTPSFGQATQSQAVGSGTLPDAFTQAISSLVPSTIYYYRVVATSAGGVAVGTTSAFTTRPAKPTVVALPVTEITTESATLRATVNPNENMTTAYFEYGTTSSFGQTTQSQAVSSDTLPKALEQAISSLTPNTLYYYRAVAANAGGVTIGATSTFRTSVESLVAVDDEAFTVKGEARVIDVLANDTGVPRASLVVSVIGAPAAGSATVNAEGNVVYVPNASFSGYDSFSYKVNDTTRSSTATVVIRDTFQSSGGIYNALIGTAQSPFGHAGWILVNVSRTGLITGKVMYEGGTHSFKTTLRYDGVATCEIKRKGAQPISLSLSIDPVLQKMTGTAGTPDAVAFSADRAPYNKLNPAPQVGLYTLVLASDPNVSAEGHGFASMKIDENGSIQIKGRTGAGQSFSSSAYVDGGGNFPLFASVTKPAAAKLHGALRFRNIAGVSDFDGVVGASSSVSEEVVQVSTIGSRYTVPAKGAMVLPYENALGNALLDFGHGPINLAGAPFQVTVSAKGLISTERSISSLKLDLKTGLFSGKASFGDKRYPFYGAVFQRQAQGFGVIMTLSGPGWVSLTDANRANDEQGTGTGSDSGTPSGAVTETGTGTGGEVLGGTGSVGGSVKTGVGVLVIGGSDPGNVLVGGPVLSEPVLGGTLVLPLE